MCELDIALDTGEVAGVDALVSDDDPIEKEYRFSLYFRSLSISCEFVNGGNSVKCFCPDTSACEHIMG